MNLPNSLWALLMLTIFTGGIAAHTWLGIMSTSKGWDIPEDVLISIPWAYKMAFGSFITIASQAIYRGARRSPPLERDEQAWPPTS